MEFFRLKHLILWKLSIGFTVPRMGAKWFGKSQRALDQIRTGAISSKRLFTAKKGSKQVAHTLFNNPNKVSEDVVSRKPCCKNKGTEQAISEGIASEGVELCETDQQQKMAVPPVVLRHLEEPPSGICTKYLNLYRCHS
jgi:hypothetical protein